MEQQQICDLYAQHKTGIFRYVLSITKDPQLSEDVLQDTFLKVLQSGIVCTAGKEQAWLYRVARNLCYDHLRRRKREQGHIAPPAAEEPQYEYIELIASLSPRDREIVTLKIVGGLTHQEIGAVLGISAKAAQKRYERAIAALRGKEL